MHFIHILNHFEVDFLGSFQATSRGFGSLPKSPNVQVRRAPQEALKIWGVSVYTKNFMGIGNGGNGNIGISWVKK